MRPLGRAEPLDGGDVLAGTAHSGVSQEAPPDRRPGRCRRRTAGAAAEARARQAELAAQDREQRRRRIGLDEPLDAVDAQRDRSPAYAHCALMPATLTTLAHLSMSSRR